MAKMMGNFNVNSLKKFKQNMAKLNTVQAKQFSESAIKELAARLLRKAILRTPVYKGIPEDVNNHSGGTLRRGWTIGAVTRTNGGYTVEVINPVEYASYVEFGHRGVYVPALGKTLHKDKRWTRGKFMLSISEQELQADAPRILQNKLDNFLKDVLK